MLAFAHGNWPTGPPGARSRQDQDPAASEPQAALAQDRAASFKRFIGRAFTRTVAGFALKVVCSPVKGLMPVRAFFAGTATAVIFSSPGNTKVRGPLLLIDRRIVSSSAAITAFTSFTAAPEVPARCLTSADLLNTPVTFVVEDRFAGAFVVFRFAAIGVLVVV